MEGVSICLKKVSKRDIGDNFEVSSLEPLNSKTHSDDTAATLHHHPYGLKKTCSRKFYKEAKKFVRRLPKKKGIKSHNPKTVAKEAQPTLALISSSWPNMLGGPAHQEAQHARRYSLPGLKASLPNPTEREMVPPRLPHSLFTNVLEPSK